MTTPVFNYLPEYGARAEHKLRTLEVAYRSGFNGRGTDGLNTDQERWTLDFRYRTEAEATAIDTFLRTLQGGRSFYWLPPYGQAGFFVCDSWNRTRINFNRHDINATFRRVGYHQAGDADDNVTALFADEFDAPAS